MHLVCVIDIADGWRGVQSATEVTKVPISRALWEVLPHSFYDACLKGLRPFCPPCLYRTKELLYQACQRIVPGGVLFHNALHCCAPVLLQDASL